MRFRAKILDSSALIRIFAALEKVHSEFVIHIEPGKFKCIATSDSELGIQAFCVVTSAMAFEDFVVESKAENNIFFKLSAANLLRALRSAQNTYDVVVKLTKKSFGTERATPHMTFEIQREEAEQTIEIMHDVPLQMLNGSDMEAYMEPEIPPASVQLYMPPIKMFRAVIDRLKAIDSHVTIKATMAGIMTIRADPCGLESNITFKNLKTVEGECEDDAEAELRIDVKKLARVLYAGSLHVNDIIGCFHEQRALAVHLLSDHTFMSYYIPLVALDYEG